MLLPRMDRPSSNERLVRQARAWPKRIRKSGWQRIGEVMWSVGAGLSLALVVWVIWPK